MATVNFSVPDDVKAAFNETFEGRNKSAVIAELMCEAVERVRRGEQSRTAIREILGRRRGRRFVSNEEIPSARHEGRP